VKLDRDTVWLNQQQLADLYGTKRQAITKHIANIYECEELEKPSTSSILEQVRKEGNRMVTRKIEYYNLDMIISVGYRVNTKRGIQFRQWANSVLKDYLLRGYSVNRQLIALQERTDERFHDLQHQLDKQRDKVEFLVRIHHTDEQRLFPTGCVFDAWEHISALVRSAKERITLIDNYCDERTLLILAKRNPEVTCTIHTRFTDTFKQDLDKHNRQYPAISYIQLPHKEHDRFLIIDKTVYILGDSLKDLGHSMTTVLKTTFTPEEILAKLK